jgi:hypothetical protein
MRPLRWPHCCKTVLGVQDHIRDTTVGIRRFLRAIIRAQSSLAHQIINSLYITLPSHETRLSFSFL